ncbi:MAG: sensor histidine kinase [Actinomycetota bacterium]
MTAARPFDRFQSIRAKLAAAIIVAVVVTIAVIYALLAFTLPGTDILQFHARTGIWADTMRFIRDAWWLLLPVAGLAGFAALAFVRVWARGMTQPLRAMAAAAGNMARGDYGERVYTNSRDEVGKLAEAFNQMASELEGLERMRRELIANVSHELKTPIAAIRAHLENLLEGVEQPDTHTLEVMLRQSERLSTLVEQVLDLSRLESGQMELSHEVLSIRSLAEQAAAEARIARNVEVRCEIPDDIPFAIGDRVRIHQVLYNVLDNAGRFTRPGGCVIVRAKQLQQKQQILVTVDDDGPGVSPEQRSLIFERFYRADSARSRPEGGAGLGLAIARSIVEAHGGRIWVEDRPDGMPGARFSFSLPAGALIEDVKLNAEVATRA